MHVALFSPTFSLVFPKPKVFYSLSFRYACEIFPSVLQSSVFYVLLSNPLLLQAALYLSIAKVLISVYLYIYMSLKLKSLALIALSLVLASRTRPGGSNNKLHVAEGFHLGLLYYYYL